MTQLTPILYAVEVPSDATEIKIGSLNMGIYFYVNERIDCVNLGFNLKGDFKILGEVTKDEINFNCDDIVKNPEEIYVENWDGNLNLELHYLDYEVEKFFLLKANESFRSLLQSKGICFENPVEKPKGEHYYYDNKVSFDEIETLWDGGSYNEDLEKWQESENKVIKGKLIILEKL